MLGGTISSVCPCRPAWLISTTACAPTRRGRRFPLDTYSPPPRCIWDNAAGPWALRGGRVWPKGRASLVCWHRRAASCHHSSTGVPIGSRRLICARSFLKSAMSSPFLARMTRPRRQLTIAPRAKLAREGVARDGERPKPAFRRLPVVISLRSRGIFAAKAGRENAPHPP